MSKSRDIADSAATINYIDGLTADAQTQLDGKATLSGSPTFTGTVTATSFSGDGSALTGVDSLPSQTGEAGKYLTTDGTDASWGEISASPTYEAIASGSLANGDLVSVNSDGTVSVVSGNATYSTTTGPTFASTFLEANNVYKAAYDPVAGKIVLIYNSVDSNRYGTAVVASISGTTLTFGTPVTFWSSSGFQIQNIIHEPSSGKMVVVGYTSSSAFSSLVGTVSGTSISFGTAVSVGYKPLFNAYSPALCLTGTANQFLLAWSGGDYPYGGFAVVGTISGTSISYGSSALFHSGEISRLSCDYNSAQDKVLVTYRHNAGSSYGTATVLSISGTTITFGTNTVFNSVSTTETQVMYHPPSEKMIIAYNQSGLYARAATISGTSATYSSALQVIGSGINFVNKNAAGFVNEGCYFSFTSTSNNGFITRLGVENGLVVDLTESGSSNKFYEFLPNDSFFMGCIAYDTGNNKIAAFSYSNPSSNSFVISPYFTTAPSFIGISDGAYSDGATATIQIVGSVDDAQSGLVAGKEYYLTTDGALSGSAGDLSIYVGKAVSSTSIIVKG